MPAITLFQHEHTCIRETITNICKCIFFPIPHLISNTTNKNILYTYNKMIDIHNKKHVVSILVG